MPGRTTTACALAVALVAAAIAVPRDRAAGADPAAPNIVFLHTDDQPARDMAPLEKTRELIGQEGATFNRAYATTPLCCPSRASMLTGLYTHNHGVRGNGGTYGGWHRFRDGVGEANALPVRLDDAGYYSVHIGKYMNGFAGGDYLYVAPGWDEWYARNGGEQRVYYDYNLIERGPDGFTVPRQYEHVESDYSTDVFTAKALDFLERAPTIGQPFFLSVGFAAPHHPFVPAPRHNLTLAGGGLPVRLGFNERNMRDKPRWLRREARHRIGPGERRKIAAQQRRRDETMLAVDESVDAIVNSLEEHGLLDDTVIIYTSDNGLFRGEHRLTGGKYLPYEPASHIPLLIRGPGIPAGTTVNELVSNVDLGRTILEAAGVDDPSVDGRSVIPFAQNPSLRTTRPILIEGDTGPGRGIGAGNDPDLDISGAVARAGLARMAGVKNLDQEKLAGASQGATGDRAPAYRALRTDRYLFTIYSTGDRELYDMSRDPGQLRSLARSKRYAGVRAWMFARLLEFINCQGAACRREIGTPPAPGG